MNSPRPKRTIFSLMTMSSRSVFLFSLLLLIGCGPGKDSPEFVAEQYLTAMKNKDYEKAKTYGEETARENIDCMIRMNEDFFQIMEVKDIECDVDGNRATCTFCCDKENLNSIDLVRLNETSWYVSGVKEICPDEYEAIESAD